MGDPEARGFSVERGVQPQRANCSKEWYQKDREMYGRREPGMGKEAMFTGIGRRDRDSLRIEHRGQEMRLTLELPHHLTEGTR